ncbi:hypothetical protein JKP88DRAFT_250234 [Tribonema minus]|uniref:Uncharacterized protein n=1 Tax=Tribonema minus TaxID=303371 RepID=A0A835YKK3_9STRA|nr:hypothetical protein JKP88DRAFT_250234 [Tribonema minus]
MYGVVRVSRLSSTSGTAKGPNSTLHSHHNVGRFSVIFMIITTTLFARSTGGCTRIISALLALLCRIAFPLRAANSTVAHLAVLRNKFALCIVVAGPLSLVYANAMERAVALGASYSPTQLEVSEHRAAACIGGAALRLAVSDNSVAAPVRRQQAWQLSAMGALYLSFANALARFVFRVDEEAAASGGALKRCTANGGSGLCQPEVNGCRKVWKVAAPVAQIEGSHKQQLLRLLAPCTCGTAVIAHLQSESRPARTRCCPVLVCIKLCR